MAGAIPDNEHEALLALNLTDGIGQGLTQRLLEHFGSAEQALGAPAKQWAEVHRLSLQRAQTLKKNLDALQSNGAIEQEREALAQHDVHLIAIHDQAYPKLLRHISDPPQLLWVRGDLREEDALALGIVGSRRCTHYGREQADRFAADATAAGLCVVSGGAQGIDVAAHRAALRLNGRTLAVVGSGLANPYPKANHEVFEAIAEPGAGRGAVISELPMHAPTQAENFPRRNRIISGLSLGVLVVEAAARSGALITARLCVEDHGRELMAVPGRVDSKASEGCHKMIRQGWATLVTGGADVLDALGETGQILKADMAANDSHSQQAARDENATEAQAPANDATDGNLFDANLTASQRQIIEALDQPRTLDQLVAVTELEAAQVQSELTLMELHGTIERQGGLVKRRR
jgi:DNA processing protein